MQQRGSTLKNQGRKGKEKKIALHRPIEVSLITSLLGNVAQTNICENSKRNLLILVKRYFTSKHPFIYNFHEKSIDLNSQRYQGSCADKMGGACSW